MMLPIVYPITNIEAQLQDTKTSLVSHTEKACALDEYNTIKFKVS
jgi:hypothetical protein